MLNSKILAFTAIVIACIISWSCTRGGAVSVPAANPAPPISRDFAIKEAALKEMSPTGANPLKLEHSIKRGEGGKFVYPSRLFIGEEGRVLIADNNGHAIHSYSAGEKETTTLPTPIGEGALRFPIAIQAAQKRIYVVDDEGIKIFKENGQYEKLLRTYYSLWDFALSQDGSIYANAAYKSPKDSDGLIVKLNANGERVSSFGRRLNHLQYKGLDDRVYLVCSGQLLFVAFRHRPLVAVYDLAKEELVREITLKHPVFSQLETLSKDESYTNPSPSKTALPRYVAGITVVDDRVFVLLHLPRVEIVEFDFQGNEQNRFRYSEVSGVVDYFGLGARNEHGVRKFYVGVSGVLGAEEAPFLTQLAVASSD